MKQFVITMIVEAKEEPSPIDHLSELEVKAEDLGLIPLHGCISELKPNKMIQGVRTKTCPSCGVGRRF